MRVKEYHFIVTTGPPLTVSAMAWVEADGGGYVAQVTGLVRPDVGIERAIGDAFAELRDTITAADALAATEGALPN